MNFEAWRIQQHEWTERVRIYGPARAARNTSLKTEEQALEFDSIQKAAVLPVLLKHLRITDDVVLDFGCGTGRWSTYLGRTFGRCVAIDPTASLSDLAQLSCGGDPHVEVLPYDGGRIPMRTGEASVIFSCLVLNTILDSDMMAEVAAEFDRVLALDGLLFIVDLTEREQKTTRWSTIRSVNEYQRLFAGIAPLEHEGGYLDCREVHSILAGRKQ